MLKIPKKKKKAKIVRVNVIGCRTCNKEFTYPKGYPTREGELTFCFNCGEISVFTNTGSLRAPTTEELADDNIDWPVVEEYRKFLKGGTVY